MGRRAAENLEQEQMLCWPASLRERWRKERPSNSLNREPEGEVVAALALGMAAQAVEHSQFSVADR